MLSAKRSRTGSSRYSPAPSSALKRDLLRSFIMFSPVEWTSGYKDAKSVVVVGAGFTQKYRFELLWKLGYRVMGLRYSTNGRTEIILDLTSNGEARRAVNWCV